jgi:hypothetical protein
MRVAQLHSGGIITTATAQYWQQAIELTARVILGQEIFFIAGLVIKKLATSSHS